MVLPPYLVLLYEGGDVELESKHGTHTAQCSQVVTEEKAISLVSRAFAC
jgi:hypothetical protein